MATENPSALPQKLTRDEFLHEHISGKSDREVMEDIAYHLYVYGQKLYDVARNLGTLDVYVHQIEKDAHEAMSGMMSPEGMAKMAAEFMSPS